MSTSQIDPSAGDRAHIASFARLRLRHVTLAVQWLIMLGIMAIAVGSLCALFLWLLDKATEARFAHPAILYGLPLGGMVVGLAYHWFGKSAEAGNNLIVDQIHEPGGGVPLRMAPLVLIGTVITHFFGGSAGREGTAVQLGGSLASAFGRIFRLSDIADVRMMLMAGVAAGFGAVFSTPIAGAVFALEVLTIGQVRYRALVPCLFAALVADYSCHAWGIHHMLYHIGYAVDPVTGFHIQPLLLLKAGLAGVVFGLAGLLFSEASHGLGGLFRKYLPWAPLRPFVGGLLVIALVWICGTREYLGLGVWSPNPEDVTIAKLFDPQIHPWAWALKLLFTVVTLSAGFKGGEVTPLFFIGAALGNVLSWILGAPTDLFAGLGFVAMFAGAANTPLACTLMGIELFGAGQAAYIAAACFVAYLCSGHSGIYLSQRIGIPKTGDAALSGAETLREARAGRVRLHMRAPS